MTGKWLDEPLRLFPELLSEGTSRYVVLAKEIGELDENGKPGGQVIYRFPNGLAGSVIRQIWNTGGGRFGTYGAVAGLFEVAVGQYDSDGRDDWHVVKTPLIEDGVSEGWKTPRDVESFLLAIKNLDPTDTEALS